MKKSSLKVYACALVECRASLAMVLGVGILALTAFPAQAQLQAAIRVPVPAMPEPAARESRGFFQRVADGLAGRKQSTLRSQPVRHVEEGQPTEITRVPPPVARVAPLRKQPVKNPTRSAKEAPKTAQTKPDDRKPSAPTPPQPPAFVGESVFAALAAGNMPAPSAGTPAIPMPDASPDSGAAPAPMPEGPPPFAVPVPGKKGLVYPPGEPETRENRVDVRDAAPGETVRDPRTGKTFRVP
jgi:antitoxin (DNA-binding transcriptional repressor) of toxin-antitoxin stability system